MLSLSVGWRVIFVLFAVPAVGQQLPLSITTQSAPAATVGRPYMFQLEAQAGIPPYTWRVAAGTLPPGLRLDANSGVTSGVPISPGEFRFTVELSDSGSPPAQVQRTFAIRVNAALTVDWKQPPEIQDQGIWGQVVVSNQTGQDFDLTVIVLAVNEIGKAFALGYQHFTIKPQMTSPPIPFGSSLPNGNYVVHVDAIAEAPSVNSIYRARLQTPASLQIRQE